MLRIEKISKKVQSFSLSDISLKIEKGGYFVLLGPSGAGKSMLFDIIGGILKSDKGSIFLENTDITHSAVQKRQIGIVFQQDCLFPHMNVFQNIAYSLKVSGQLHTEIQNTVARIAAEMSIEKLLNRKPASLSGGERQRVSIARSLAHNPKCLLFDEPLTFLDVGLRDEIMTLLKKINNNGLTIMHITHDPMEAFALAKNMAVIENGKIIQSDIPENIYKNPQSEFLKTFIASMKNQKQNLPAWIK